jgi:hypothetical protein
LFLDHGEAAGMSSSFLSSSFVDRHKLVWPAEDVVVEDVEEIDFDQVSEVSFVQLSLNLLLVMDEIRV